MEPMTREYLGDSVYILFDGHSLTIYLDNGAGANSEIVMEPAVLQNLVRFALRCGYELPQAVN